MHIKKLTTGETVTIRVDENWDLGDLCEVIVEKFGIPVKWQRIEFNGKPLCTREHRSLNTYGISNESTVVISGRMVGGCGPNGLCGKICGTVCGCGGNY